MVKKILIGLLAVLVIIQFFHPDKTVSDDASHDITTAYNVPENVQVILDGACNDCHSNKTTYPWYSKLQPIDWWLSHHVDEGRRELNFSTFTTRRLAVQNHKLEEIIETVKEKEMPLPSYTWLGLHPEANLSDEQRATITAWAQAQMDTLKNKYPADSLVLRRKQPPTQ